MNNRTKLIGLGVAAVALMGVVAFFVFGNGLFGGNKTGSGQVITTAEHGGSCLVTYFPKDGDIEIILSEDGEVDNENADVADDGIEVDPDPQNWRVYDIHGNMIDSSVVLSGNKLTIKAPDGGYESGGIYVLDIGDNAKFVGEEYGSSRHMVFGVDRGESRIVEYNDNVYEIDEEIAQVGDDVIVVQGAYKEGDILLADFDGDRFIEAITITDAVTTGDTTTINSVEIPDRFDIYKELDVFTIEHISFENAVFNDNVIVRENDTVGILDGIITPVYAEEEQKEKSEFSIEAKILHPESEKVHNGTSGKAGGLEIKAGVEFNTIKGKKSKSGKCELALTFKGDAILCLNLSELYFDITFEQKGEVEIETKAEYNLNPEEKTLSQAVREFYSSTSQEQEGIDAESRVAVITIPTPIPIPVEIDIEFEAKASASVGVNISETLSPYARLWVFFDGMQVHDTSGIEFPASFTTGIEVGGKVEGYGGFKIHPYVGVPNTLEAGINVGVGPYVELGGVAKSKVSLNTDKKSKQEDPVDFSGFLAASFGLKLKGDISIEHKDLFDVKNWFTDNKLKTTVFETEKKWELKSWDTGPVLLDVNLKDKYIVADGIIDLEKVEASYTKLIDDSQITEELTDYKLYIDGELVQDGKILSDKQNNLGKHQLKLSWTYGQKDYEYEKEVEFVEGSKVAWVVEPNYDYNNIAQIEMGINSYTGAKIYSGIGKNKIGYPQQWYDAVEPSNGGSGEKFTYTANAIAVGRLGFDKWSVIDYNGNVLMADIISDSPFVKDSPLFTMCSPGIEYHVVREDGAMWDAKMLSKDFKEVLYSVEFGLRGSDSDLYCIFDNRIYSMQWAGGSNVNLTEVAKLEDLKAPSRKDLEPFRDALIPVAKERPSSFSYDSDEYTYKYTYIGKDGTQVAQDAFYVKNHVNGYYVGLPKSEKYSDVSSSQEFAIIQASSGKPITEYKYYDALYFEEGFCPVCRDGKWGFIDSTGTEVTEMFFDKVSTVYEGKAAVVFAGESMFAIINLKDSVAGGILTEEVFYDAMTEILFNEEVEEEKDDELSDEEISAILNAISGTWAEVHSPEYQYVINGMDVLRKGFDSSYNNVEEGFLLRATEIRVTEVDGRTAYVLILPYSDAFLDTNLWIYKDDIKNGKCERIYSVFVHGYQYDVYETELTRVEE